MSNLAQPHHQSQGVEQDAIGSGQMQQTTQDGEMEMFEDIVANTNPYLAALPDRDLYINHGVNYFDTKRNLLRASNSFYDVHAFGKKCVSEGASEADHIDFNDYDDMDSDFSEDQSDREILELLDSD